MKETTFNYIKENFLALTKKTYPYGDEDLLKEEGLLLDCLEQDDHGNYFTKIGESRTIFASHLDTVSTTVEDVVHVFEDDGNTVKTDGKTILGADDKAGVVLMYWLIKHKVPGLYYFFVGEEVGCFGSGMVANYNKDELENEYDRIISFDRKGIDSIITYQSSYRTCSEKFSKALAEQLNQTEGFEYKSDDTGSYTDSAEFTAYIPECTNLSVGYYAQHTNAEKQDLKHLAMLADALLDVKWEELPTERDPSKVEKKTYTYLKGRYRYDGRYTSEWQQEQADKRGNTNQYSRGSGGFVQRDYSRTQPDYNYGNDWNSGSTYRPGVDDYEYCYNHSTRSVSVKPKGPIMITDGKGGSERTKKKTRRAGKKNNKGATQGELFYVNGPNKGRRLLDMGGGNLLDISEKPHKGELDGVKEKLLMSNISKQELKNVKEQYLDACLSESSKKDYQEVFDAYGFVL